MKNTISKMNEINNIFRMNKKAQFGVARKTVYWTIIAVVITMIVIFFAFLLANYKNRLSEVPKELQAELISLRFVNAPECFAYQEPSTGRILHSVIDIDKFTEEQMNQCYSTAGSGGIKTFNFRLSLVNGGEGVFTDKYYHYDRPDFSIIKEVLVKRGSDLQKDQLMVYIQEKVGG